MSLMDRLRFYLNDIHDPRVLNRCSHNLIDLLVIKVLGVLSNAESFVEVERWANSKIEWLKKFLELSNGIPSHDTFARVLSLIDPKEFELVFMKWVKDSRVNIKNDVLCIDGKISKGTVFHKKGSSKDMLNTVHVFSTLTQLVLGQFASAGGNSESTSAMELLDFFDIRGCTIVGDAGIGLKSVANKIHEKKIYISR